MEPGLQNAHKDVDVGRLAANKIECCNPNHFNISYLKTLFTFWFHIYAIDYLDSCFDYLITLLSDLNQLINGSRS